jgi:acetolactate decarboxylase
MAIDPELIHALHLSVEDHAAATADPAAAHRAFQTSTVQALIDSRYEGDLSVGELLAHGDLGLGTIDGLDGELIVVHGQAFVARADGSVAPVADDVRTPFAVVTPFAPGTPRPVKGLAHDALLATLDSLSTRPVHAVRAHGHFSRLRVRSVPRQYPPYPPLDAVTAQQVEWEIGPVDAVLVGFRFPSLATGLEVPGWHLHALADDRRSGGHVLIADLDHGTIELDPVTEVHCELPAGVEIAAPADDLADRIHAAETQANDAGPDGPSR